MDSVPMLSRAELDAAALEYFVYQPVDKEMVKYLAKAASNVIQCDPTMMPPPTHTTRSRLPTPAGTAPPRVVRSSDGPLPSIEDFITQLVISSNVQVPTLMSTLVYLNRLKSRLQPMARGLRCTAHRIFLAALILAAKYLNDSSPKNKHWARYSIVSTHAYNFGFSRTEVNLMEKQLLFLLDWDLRITEDDLYTELEPFLAPIRADIEARYARRMRKQAEKERQRQLALARQREEEEEACAAAAAAAWRAALSQSAPKSGRGTAPPSRALSAEHAYASPPSSRGSSRSRSHARDVSPPGLYHSSASSYASSTTSRATTPVSEADPDAAEPYVYESQVSDAGQDAVVYESSAQVQAALAGDPAAGYGQSGKKAAPATQILPCEISAEEARALEEMGRGKKSRGVWGRMLGAVTAR